MSAIGRIETVNSIEDFEQSLREATDGEVLAQECVQKGAIYALQQLLRGEAVNRIEAQALLDASLEAADVVSAECARRGLGTIKDPRAI